jgi:hypothetical protein
VPSPAVPTESKAETLGVSLPVADARSIREIAASEGRPISTVIRRGLLAAGYLKPERGADG